MDARDARRIPEDQSPGVIHPELGRRVNLEIQEVTLEGRGIEADIGAGCGAAHKVKGSKADKRGGSQSLGGAGYI
jgi:hypothetical protein